jgi:hypothetical protein
VGGSVGQAVEHQVAGMIAQKMGIDQSMVESALGALMQNHTQPNDTVQASAEQTGISPDIMGQIMGHIGGEGALGSLIGQIGGAQQQAGGDLMGQLGGLVGGLMGGQKS